MNNTIAAGSAILITDQFNDTFPAVVSEIDADGKITASRGPRAIREADQTVSINSPSFTLAPMDGGFHEMRYPSNPDQWDRVRVAH